jgi:hypothetical protein
MAQTMLGRLETREEYLLEKALRREQRLAMAPVLAIFCLRPLSGPPQPLHWTAARDPKATFPAA